MTELFIKYLKGHVGDIYVWGAQGETNITEKWIRRRETGEKNAERAIALWEKRKAEGRSPIAAFDCSGLIVKFLLDNKLIKSWEKTGPEFYAKIQRDIILTGADMLKPGGKMLYSTCTRPPVCCIKSDFAYAEICMRNMNVHIF